jgi:hypothetical protein
MPLATKISMLEIERLLSTRCQSQQDLGSRKKKSGAALGARGDEQLYIEHLEWLAIRITDYRNES